jgi:hypothetical protein
MGISLITQEDHDNVLKVISSHVLETRGLMLWCGGFNAVTPVIEVPKQHPGDTALFQADTFAECVEWALKQPTKDYAEMLHDLETSEGLWCTDKEQSGEDFFQLTHGSLNKVK